MSCNATTKAGAPCKLPCNDAYTVDGKTYCFRHCPNKSVPSVSSQKGAKAAESSETNGKAASSKAASSKTTKAELTKASDDTYDISSSAGYETFLPWSVCTFMFNEFEFFSIEQAYHFMKFYHPSASRSETESLLTVMNDILQSNSIESVRKIAHKHQNIIYKGWGGVTGTDLKYSDRVLFDIMVKMAKVSSSFRNKLASISTEIIDSSN